MTEGDGLFEVMGDWSVGSDGTIAGGCTCACAACACHCPGGGHSTNQTPGQSSQDGARKDSKSAFGIDGIDLPVY